jgi:probable rRNA maturation factor
MITIEPPGSLSISALSKSGLTRFLNRARAAVGLEGDVDVLLADDLTLRRLNKTFRGKNKPTDVLSFPAPDEIARDHAGDLAISLETANRQAATYNHSLRDEVRILLLHGLLHLSGLDHEADNGEMAAREAELRVQLGLTNGLIERVSEPRQRGPLKHRRTA